MKITAINENSTHYGDGKHKTGKDLQKLMTDIINHHNLTTITLKTIPNIKNGSDQ